MICDKLNDVWEKLIKNPLTRAYILAFGRHMITLLGGILVAHGYLHGDDVSDVLGFLTTATGIYLAQIDVKGVDQKVRVALQSSPEPGISNSDPSQYKPELQKLKSETSTSPGVK